MNVQELIDELMNIKDKTMIVSKEWKFKYGEYREEKIESVHVRDHLNKVVID